MFFPDVLKRWRGSANDAATVVDGVADACPPPTSLLEELAADSEDFAEVAAVLRVELRTVIATLVTAQPPTAVELVERLRAAQTAEPGSPNAAAVSAAAAPSQPSWGGGEEAGGWGRWTRVHGGTRVRRTALGRKPATASRPAMAAS